ncbi:family 43 glycosylhydrolase [Cytobacillus oceanisediminis]|uniref:glycoside hydrolase family 117 protein n=1 Tax=Cytobacillus oceanisediminis TaxID=665099 RepID=UPI0011A7CE57|nr:family 43 glycosylhydrolase [Cytobacillus oceanisediminis]MBZ9535818.1 family 43 glycosylhydrolase [Cytobacillus oceanisediminis]
MKKESAATIRAKNYTKDCNWFCYFRTSGVNGLGYEDGVHRRDPSSVIKVDDLYYTWYTKSVGEHAGFGTGDPEAKVFPWDLSEVWYATSPDGVNWEEQGLAVGRGPRGSYDDRSVFTPEILHHEDKFYLVYQVIQHPYLLRQEENIAMAIADSPRGPWRKLDKPILRPSGNGEWYGDDDNRLTVKSKGDFDSLKVHDPALFFYKGQFWLYYKGEPKGEEMNFGGRPTKWGVAISDNPEGPYIKSEYNPVSNSGHETLLWHYRGGMAGLLSTDGPEKNTIQYAHDGINFEIEAVINHPPEAAGPYRTDNPDVSPLEGIRWGLCHVVASKWNYIQKFEVDETMKHLYMNKVSPEQWQRIQKEKNS